MNKVQLATRTENEIKAFVYQWYGRFDKGTNMDELKPFLPDKVVEFVYPQATITSVDELVKYAEQTFDNIKSSAHYLDEIFVYQVAENKYEVICPHSYHALQPNGEYVNMNFIGRMKIDTSMKTVLDPEGANIKIFAYKVVLQGNPNLSSKEFLDDVRMGDVLTTDAKEFVHNWFSLIDSGDANSLMNMTSDLDLNINIMGNQLSNKEDLKDFLLAQKESQNYSSHRPHNIVVNKASDGFDVKFILHFEGQIKELGLMHLSNITSWKLIIEENRLKLIDYSLEIL